MDRAVTVGGVMALGGKAGPTFSTFKSHGEVRCKACGRSLADVPHKAYGFTTGKWMKVCKPCRCCTWYDIAPPDDATWRAWY